MWFLPILFFLSPILFVLTGVNVNDPIYGLFVLCLGLRPLKGDRISFPRNLIAISLTFFILIACGIGVGFFNGYKSSIIFTEALYYLKPVIFLLYGYFYLNETSFNKLTFFGFWIVVIGSLVYFSNPPFFIEKAIEKAHEVQGVGHFYAIHHTMLRNSSLLLSPLETGYVLFFMTSYLYAYKPFKHPNFYFIVSASLLVLTYTRSVIIGFILAFVLFKLLEANVIKKIYFLFLFIIIAIFVGIIYLNQLALIFIQDGSAVLHLRNLTEGVWVILDRPFGYGIGYSGFGSLQSTTDKFYSEGSFFTSIIENGILFLFFYICIFFYLNQVSRNKLLPIYLGFLTASMLIPIGFSTIFNCLFFSYLGIIIKREKSTETDSSSNS
jgi:hypothetical protein